MSAWTPLLAVSTEALGPRVSPTGLPAALAGLLAERNGFYAFSGALHVFPWQSADEHVGLIVWNAPERWRSLFPELPQGGWFFAEDVFGWQFWTAGGEVLLMDPESAALEPFAASLEAWAAKLAADGDEAGAGMAAEWAEEHGPLRPGWRLAPRIPFAFAESRGSGFGAVESGELMRFRADLKEQLREHPDGTKVKLVVR